MATRKEVEQPDGTKLAYLEYKGFYIQEQFVKTVLAAKDLELQIQWVKETEIRDDDVILCAFPKTGTHWTWEIINMIQRGTTEYEKRTKVDAMLELVSQELTSSLPSPRVLNTHLWHELLPAGIKEKKCKIIHVMRNPKDVFVSYYFHMKSECPEMPNMDWFAKIFNGELGVYEYCSYPWYIKHFEQFCAENPDYPLLNVFYEDLQRNPDQEIKRIAKFLGKDLNDDTLSEIREKCNFDNLKRANDEWKNDPIKARSPGGKSFIYRKGAVGDWKNHLTVAQNEAFDKWLGEEMKGSNIKFQYE